jgi:hypothetical protein
VCVWRLQALHGVVKNAVDPHYNYCRGGDDNGG